MDHRSRPQDILAQRARLQDVFASLSDQIYSKKSIIWIWEVQNGKFFFNADMPGYTGRENPSSIDFAEFWEKKIHPEDRRAFMRHVGKIIKSTRHGDRFEFFYRLLFGGEYQWVLSRGRVVDREDSGRATRLAGALLDMRTLSDINEKLIVQKERMAYALEATQGGLWDWSPATGEAYFSPRYFTMMGYEPDGFPHSFDAWTERVHKDDLKSILRPQVACIESPAGGERFEVIYRFLAADGGYRWILSRGKVIARGADGRARRLVGLHIDITDLRAEQEAMALLVNCDPLTKLGSRFSFDAAYNELEVKDLPVSMIYMDVDGLKMVNDTMGHAAGDSLLIKAADLMRQAFRSRDLLARIGGDEFVALLKNCPQETALRLVLNVRKLCDAHNSGAENMPIMLSIGMAGTEQGVALSDLLVVADKAMIRDKVANSRANYKALANWLALYTDRRLETQPAAVARKYAPRLSHRQRHS